MEYSWIFTKIRATIETLEAPMTNDNEILRMALVGYRQQIADLSAKVTEIEKGLRAPVHTKTRRALAVVGAPQTVHVVKKRKMSAAGRAHIIAAQKARWAKVKKAAKVAKAAA
jgi:hypothetical protein